MSSTILKERPTSDPNMPSAAVTKSTLRAQEIAAIVFFQPLLRELILLRIDHRSTLASCMLVNSDWFSTAVRKLWSGHYFPLYPGWDTSANPHDLSVFRPLQTCPSRSRVAAYAQSVKLLEIGNADSEGDAGVLPGNDVLARLNPEAIHFHSSWIREFKGPQKAIIPQLVRLLGPSTRFIEITGSWYPDIFDGIKQFGQSATKLALMRCKTQYPEGLCNALLSLLEAMPQLTYVEVPVCSTQKLLGHLIRRPELKHVWFPGLDAETWLEELRASETLDEVFPALESIHMKSYGPDGPRCLREVFERSNGIRKISFEGFPALGVGTHHDRQPIYTGDYLQPLLALQDLTELRLSIPWRHEIPTDWQALPDALKQLVVSSPALVHVSVTPEVARADGAQDGKRCVSGIVRKIALHLHRVEVLRLLRCIHMDQEELILLSQRCPRLRVLEVHEGYADLSSLAAQATSSQTCVFLSLEALSLAHYANSSSDARMNSGALHCHYCITPPRSQTYSPVRRGTICKLAAQYIRASMPRLRILKNLTALALPAQRRGLIRTGMQAHGGSKELPCRLAQDLHKDLGLDEYFDGASIGDDLLATLWVRDRRRKGFDEYAS